jgi:hypothetical protein
MAISKPARNAKSLGNAQLSGHYPRKSTHSIPRRAEKKKPKADKNQSKANVSAYKAAQGQGKPASSPFAKKT